MANILDRMEESIFEAQLARLSRVTGRTPDRDFLREMYARVKARYPEELKNRKIRLRALDGARLDEIVSYIFYYHVFYTSHLPAELVARMEADEKYRALLVRDVSVYIVINEHLNVENSPSPPNIPPRSPPTTWRAATRCICWAA